MILSALLLAAAVQAAPPSPAAPRAFIGPNGLTRIYASESEALAAMTRREACRRSLLQRVDTDAPAKFRSLGDLPQADHTLAVLRTQGGCPVFSTIRYNVGR